VPEQRGQISIDTTARHHHVAPPLIAKHTPIIGPISMGHEVDFVPKKQA
jgi:hypothetical protein